jgi:Tfp pilus assembly major pilin PilA
MLKLYTHATVKSAVMNATTASTNTAAQSSKLSAIGAAVERPFIDAFVRFVQLGPMLNDYLKTF